MGIVNTSSKRKMNNNIYNLKKSLLIHKWTLVGINLMVDFIHQMYLEGKQPFYFEVNVYDMPDTFNFATT